MSSSVRRKGLRRKIVLSLLIVGSIPVLVGLVITYWNGTLKLRESMGANFQGLATEAARKTDLVIEREIDSKKHLATTQEIRAAIETSNRRYRGLSEQQVNMRIAEMKERWDREDRILKEDMLLSETSSYLRNYMMTKGAKYIAFFVTDDKGAVVASANGFPGYVHNHQDWWRGAYNNGIGKTYIGDLYFNDKAQVYTINIAIPVVNEEKRKVIGVLVVYHDVRELLQPSIHDIRFGKTGHAMLIDSEGRVLTCPLMPTGSLLTDKTLVANVTLPRPHWVIAKDDGHGGNDSIIGLAPVVMTSDITRASIGKMWHSFVRQDPKELYAPINSLLTSVALSGIVLIGFVAIMGLWLSKRLARPIQLLQKGVEEIGQGNLNVKLDIKTKDEIQQLATGFNQMAEKLRESHSTLEQKVAERTRQLSALNIIAMTTNRSLVLQTILEDTLDKVLEVMQFQAGAIRLMDEDTGKLVLHSSRGLPLDLVQKYGEISLGEMLSGQAAISGQPMIIEDAQKIPGHESPVLEMGMVSLVVIPLKSKDKVLGTLTGASNTPRSFSRQDLELLASIGSQLGIAIENATLYTKTRAMVEQLKEADRFKSEVFSNISHEFRTPLTSIIGYSELLREKLNDNLDPKHEEYIANIQNSSNLLLENINNLLDLARIKAGKMEIKFGEFSVKTLIQRCIKAVSPIAAKKGQKIDIKIENGRLMINADEIKIRQIILNLLTNAIKFTPQDGTILIQGRPLLLNGQSEIEISVADNGIGIKQEDLDKIFEEFKQTDSSYTREYAGSGLGLSIVKKFVEMHGGRIDVESQPGKGSLFSVFLPNRSDQEKDLEIKHEKIHR